MADWDVNSVLCYIKSLGLGHVEHSFLINGIDGAMLIDLSEEELVQELGLTKIQAKKIKSRLR